VAIYLRHVDHVALVFVLGASIQYVHAALFMQAKMCYMVGLYGLKCMVGLYSNREQQPCFSSTASC